MVSAGPEPKAYGHPYQGVAIGSPRARGLAIRRPKPPRLSPPPLASTEAPVLAASFVKRHASNLSCVLLDASSGEWSTSERSASRHHSASASIREPFPDDTWACFVSLPCFWLSRVVLTSPQPSSGPSRLLSRL